MEKSVPPSGVSNTAALITVNDLVQTLRLIVVGILSWITPSVLWPRLSVALATIDRRIRPEEIARQTEMFAALLGDTPPPVEITEASIAANYEDRLQLFRDYRPGGWQPETQLIGEEFLRDALARRKGVILWTSYFVYSGQMTKMSLARHHYKVTHLSRPTHGFSNSRFGMSVLNRIQTRIEDRYLLDRIQIRGNDTLPALMAMRRRLHKNGIVSITLGTQASRLIERPFLNGRIRIPTGPVELAQLTDSVLLPVYTVRDKYWHYSTHIGAPMTSANESPEEVAAAYAAWLEPVVRAQPAHWRSWRMVEVTSPSSRTRAM
jgi:lauroyl/myristoyl acyltransferase